MNKYELIDSMICALNCVSVSGIQNMKTIIETIQKLGILRDGLKMEDEERANNNNE